MNDSRARRLGASTDCHTLDEPLNLGENTFGSQARGEIIRLLLMMELRLYTDGRREDFLDL